MEGEDEQEEMEEVMTVIPSISGANMKHYQMKLYYPRRMWKHISLESFKKDAV
jgi:hypothetical protein